MPPRDLKLCCANFYETDMVRRLLGDSFHPGGDGMTVALGRALGLEVGSTVLDVACGAGASGIALAKEFGCTVTGVDLSDDNLARARMLAGQAGVGRRTKFKSMDAEDLAFEDGAFDAVVSECALCTFPDKPAALSEAFRVLRPGGKVGITDVVVERELPEQVQGVLFHVACISGALPASGYQEALEAAGFVDVGHEDHPEALRELLERGERLLMGWDLVQKVYGVDLEGWLGMTKEEAKEMLGGAIRWVDEGDLSYGLFTGTRP